jgi:protein gp37
MSDTTKIEWATHTFNPWIGCTKVSPGCANCYAENSTPTRVARKNGRELWGKGKARQRTSASYWKQPLKWNRNYGQLVAEGADPSPEFRPRVFPSLCDWLEDEVPIEWLADFLKLIHDTPNLDWLLLSKRPENWGERIHRALAHIEGIDYDSADAWEGDAATDAGIWLNQWTGNEPQPPANIWIGTSVEDQTRADERIPQLLKIPAALRFLSVEPLIGEVCFRGNWLLGIEPKVHWVIVGGESGTGARPCSIEWIRDIVRQCKVAGVPCFVKQLGSKPMEEVDGGHVGVNDFALELKHPKGGEPSEWPEDLRVREFPSTSPRPSPQSGEGEGRSANFA